MFVAGADVLAECAAVSAAAADVEDGAGHRISDDAAPEGVPVGQFVESLDGGRAIAVDLDRLPGCAGQGAGGDGDAELSHYPLPTGPRSEEHTSELQSRPHLV